MIDNKNAKLLISFKLYAFNKNFFTTKKAQSQRN